MAGLSTHRVNLVLDVMLSDEAARVLALHNAAEACKGRDVAPSYVVGAAIEFEHYLKTGKQSGEE